MISEKQVIQFLKTKDRSYAQSLIDLIFNSHDTVDQETGKRICPICGSISTKKNGKDASGQQRYYCKDCFSNFSEATGTFFCHSHFTEEQWIKFIDYEISGMTLKELSHFMGVSVTTCFFMRHKIYKAASEIVQNQKLSEEVEIDSKYMKINLKGTKPDKMPRYSKTRGKHTTNKDQLSLRGISHHKICIACAIDSWDNIIMNIVGLGGESIEKYKTIQDKFKDVKKLICDSKQCFEQFSNCINAKMAKIPTSPTQKHFTTEEGEGLASVNELMTEITELIRDTRGFGTRYLQEYLDFIIIKKKLRYQHERDDQAKEFFDLVKNTESMKNSTILETEMPISLKEAYYEYRYGIFAKDKVPQQQIS